ncbi:hypothetical protein Cme02nite_00460 [Catellatospora methionotrophica]|uniref:Uncharacterized protein n=1 Tax=Catellatospora methionotrophica TaxID=121620 RepID=A0A8J3L578_9ACTN|nr:hypothetical protein Cme02nite_00460 [Catellatospora methionotrophica]
MHVRRVDQVRDSLGGVGAGGVGERGPGGHGRQHTGQHRDGAGREQETGTGMPAGRIRHMHFSGGERRKARNTDHSGVRRVWLRAVDLDDADS